MFNMRTTNHRRLPRNDLTSRMLQGEQTEDSDPDAPLPRSQRVRHAYHPLGLSGPPTPEPENIPSLVRVSYTSLPMLHPTTLLKL